MMLCAALQELAWQGCALCFSASHQGGCSPRTRGAFKSSARFLQQKAGSKWMLPLPAVAGASWSRRSNELGGVEHPPVLRVPGMASASPAASASQKFRFLFENREERSWGPSWPPTCTRQNPPGHTPAARPRVLRLGEAHASPTPRCWCWAPFICTQVAPCGRPAGFLERASLCVCVLRGQDCLARATSVEECERSTPCIRWVLCGGWSKDGDGGARAFSLASGGSGQAAGADVVSAQRTLAGRRFASSQVPADFTSHPQSVGFTWANAKRWWFPWLPGLALAAHPFCVSWLPGVDCVLANSFINSSNN